MPKRQDKIYPGEYYHVYNRGINGTTIFPTIRNYEFFMKRMQDFLSPQSTSIIVYVLMPNHYHMLVKIKDDTFTQNIGCLSNSYTKAFNSNWARTGPLFESRFKAKNIDSDEYILMLSRYIHLNPVTAQLVNLPEEWRFSSYQDYIGHRNEKFLEKEIIYSYFPGQNQHKKYQEFVEADLQDPDNKIKHLQLD